MAGKYTGVSLSYSPVCTCVHNLGCLIGSTPWIHCSQVSSSDCNVPSSKTPDWSMSVFCKNDVKALPQGSLLMSTRSATLPRDDLHYDAGKPQAFKSSSQVGPIPSVPSYLGSEWCNSQSASRSLACFQQSSL